jgi:Phage integrase family
VRVIRLHDLRHTHGTLLIAASVPVKVVSERLAHAMSAFTIETYQHVLPGMQADAARRFERLILGNLLPANPKSENTRETPVEDPQAPGRSSRKRARPRSLTWAFTHSLVAGAGFEPATFGL